MKGTHIVILKLWCSGCCQLHFQPGAALAQDFQIGIGRSSCSALLPELGMS